MKMIPNGRTATEALFGHGGDSSTDWYKRNIVRVKLPYKLLYEDPKGLIPVTTCYFHRLVAAALVAALTSIWLHARLEVKKVHGYDLTAAKYDTLTWAWLKSAGLLNYGGAFNYRLKRGSNTELSLHGLGIAIDMAPGANALGHTTTTLPNWFIKCFEDQGFFWGGNFTGRKDPMHFQYATGC